MTETKILKILSVEKNNCMFRSMNIGDLEKCDDCKYNTQNKCLLDEAIMAYEKKDLEKVEEIINGCKK